MVRVKEIMVRVKEMKILNCLNCLVFLLLILVNEVCCTDVALPYHPLDVSKSKVSHALQSKECNKGILKLTQGKYSLACMRSIPG